MIDRAIAVVEQQDQQGIGPVTPERRDEAGRWAAVMDKRRPTLPAMIAVIGVIGVTTLEAVRWQTAPCE